MRRGFNIKDVTNVSRYRGEAPLRCVFCQLGPAAHYFCFQVESEQDGQSILEVHQENTGLIFYVDSLKLVIAACQAHYECIALLRLKLQSAIGKVVLDSLIEEVRLALINI